MDADIGERLAATRTPEEAARILGTRRLVGYTIGSGAIAAACLAVSGYMIMEAVRGGTTSWSLLALPAPLVLALFFGAAAVAGAYWIATGRRWPATVHVERLVERLNSKI